MGKAVGERGGVMDSGPSKTAEAIVAVFVPPACREEILAICTSAIDPRASTA